MSSWCGPVQPAERDRAAVALANHGERVAVDVGAAFEVSAELRDLGAGSVPPPQRHVFIAGSQHGGAEGVGIGDPTLDQAGDVFGARPVLRGGAGADQADRPHGAGQLRRSRRVTAPAASTSGASVQANPRVPFDVRCTMTAPRTSALSNWLGELPKSKPSGLRPRCSPMRTALGSACLSACASASVSTQITLTAPAARAAAAVVNARTTPMTTTAPSWEPRARSAISHAWSGAGIGGVCLPKG